ncbi:hypothetical protein [Rhodanobacter lindaniclasticus]
MSAPSTEPAAACNVGPITRAGNMPTSRQASARKPIGKRIHNGGSCGSRGRSVGMRPKNTPRTKRIE